MNRFKYIVVIIVVLLIGNFTLSILLLVVKNTHREPKIIISEKLHFDKAQVKKYESFIRDHRKKIDESDRNMLKVRNELFEQLKNKEDLPKIDSLMSEIGRQQVEAEKINYHHFLEIKKLCKPSQLKDFERLTGEIAPLFSSKRRK
jgi:hypothetical protein